MEITITKALTKELREYAELKEMSIKDFVLSEILIKIRGCFVHCEKCDRVLADERELIGGSYVIKCECGNKIEIDDEEDGE